MSNAYSADNRAWRERLASTVKGITDADLGKPAGGPGWTVNGLLAHLAFYDLRAARLIEQWKAGAIGPSALDIDVSNDAMKSLFNAVAHHEIRRLVLEAAEAIDGAIDSLDPGFLSRIEAEGKPVRLNRAAHREHHLRQIESAL
ncbi:MAG TPA: maleylpyruvate isomerase N-terminal domain-containing protein [Spirochaetia bacterium]|nr:maleylpyruvate isomerase N-terminal domain-containing protein [Spirochaetia bacterium]